MIEFKEDLFDILPQRIVWCYKEWQKSYNILQEREGSNIKFIQGIPSDEDEIVTNPSAPVSVTLKNEPQVSENLYGKSNSKKVKPKFKVGDLCVSIKQNAHLIKVIYQTGHKNYFKF